MIRVVVDTNILVSAMISPTGNEVLLILAIKQGMLRICLSEEILVEYAGVLSRAKFGFPQVEITALIDMLRHQGELFQPAALPGSSPDPDDEKFMACSLAAKADFMVTGNKRDFPERHIRPTAVVRAGELLDLITLKI